MNKLYLCILMLAITTQLSAQLYTPSTGGTTGNNNVGIVTNNPQAQLVVGDEFGASVSGSGGGYGVFGSNFAIFQGGVNSNKLYTPYDHASLGYAGMRTSWGRVEFFTASGATTAGSVITPTSKMIIDANGRVGIGTVTPQHGLLELNGSGVSNGLTFWTNNGEMSSRIWVNPALNLFHITRGDQLTRGITLDINGKLGIGTGTPANKLHVQSLPSTGVPHSFSDLLIEDADRAMVQVLTGSTGVGYYGFADADDTFVGGIQYEHANDRMIFRVNDHAADVVIDNGGNVGIGTTDPGSFKLAVNGKIWTQEVNVAMTNPGPDYVFEEDYDLLSLPELEAYVKQNKRLPEVPSAQQMDEEGINLKEMNLILLKKVEELTLHLIETNKKIESQQREIAILQKKH